jgi:hypothetical protein
MSMDQTLIAWTVIIAMNLLFLFIFLPWKMEKIMQKEFGHKKTRKERKAETTEENYAGRLHGYLKAGAKLNAVHLGTVYKVEVLKPELVGGPDNGVTQISVRCQNSPLFDIFVDGDYVETYPYGISLPIARRLRHNNESINELGWLLGDFVRKYPDVSSE